MNYKFRTTFLYLASGILFAAVFGIAGCATDVTTPIVTITPPSPTIHPGDQNVPVTVGIGNRGLTGPVHHHYGGPTFRYHGPLR